MRHVERGGRYLRIVDPGWRDPLSGKHARAAGGRWNPPESFEVVYLNQNLEVARAQVRHKLEPRGIAPEDLDPDQGPDLVHTDLPAQAFVDAVTDRGLASLDLPTSYPLDAEGKPIPHERCQPIGQQARDDGEAGIACRSLASNQGEELACFSRGRRLSSKRREPFSRWYWRRPRP
jgi:hypothetical protein